jgi:SAM-dependent methyltransferase
MLGGMTTMNTDHAINRASWDELAASHGQDAYYDSEALIAGQGSLIEEEEDALLRAVGAELTGRQVLHVQCHLGFDAITFARRGARVTGVDFSTVALDKAKALADRCGVRVEWVCADVADLPDRLSGKFDLAWATFGILCWIADVRAWMRSVTRALAPGGRLVLMDGHPLGAALKDDPLRVVRPFVGTIRRPIEEGWDYATPRRTGAQVQFVHSLGEIVSAAAEAGLRVLSLKEHTAASHGLCIEHLRHEGDGRYRRRVDGHPLPVLFTLIAGA